MIEAASVSVEARPLGYKTFFSCSTQLSIKFIMLINVKMLINVEMATIVSILKFNSMINITSAIPKAINFSICRYFSFYEQLKFRDQLS